MAILIAPALGALAAFGQGSGGQGSGAVALERYLSVDGKTLDMRGQKIGAHAWSALANPAFARVEEALLARSDIDDTSAVHLAGIPALRKLDLFGTSAGNATLEALRDHAIEELDLSGTSVTDAGLAALAGMPLRRLALRDTEVSEQGVETIGEAPLRHLDLSFTAVGDDIGMVLSRFPELESLDLSSSGLTDRGFADLISLPALRWLGVAETAVSTEAVEKLRRARPEIEVRTELDTR